MAHILLASPVLSVGHLRGSPCCFFATDLESVFNLIMLRECENVYFSKCDCHAFVFLLLFIHCPFRYTSFRAWIFINSYLFHVGSLYLWSFIYVIIVPLSI